MAQGFIKNLQDKPEHERKRLTLLFSITLAVIVTLIWAAQMKHTISTYATSNQQTSVTTTQGQFSAIYQNARELFEVVRKNEQELKL